MLDICRRDLGRKFDLNRDDTCVGTLDDEIDFVLPTLHAQMIHARLNRLRQYPHPERHKRLEQRPDHVCPTSIPQRGRIKPQQPSRKGRSGQLMLRRSRSGACIIAGNPLSTIACV